MVEVSNAPAAATQARGRNLVLHEDRFFDPDPGVRRTARSLYDGVRDLPLVCPHGHVDPAVLAYDRPFPEPTALIVTPDHYIFRMLFSRGIPLEALGIPARDGTAAERDPRKIWQLLGSHYYLFRGTPTGVWLDHELHDVFGVQKKLDDVTAQSIYDEISEKLSSPEFRPRALYERFNIEVLATTDPASSTLSHHRAIRESGWKGRVLPTFRPDAVLRVAAPGWKQAIAGLEAAHGAPVTTYATLLRALEARRRFFKTFGATATDHAVEDPWTARLPEAAC